MRAASSDKPNLASGRQATLGAALRGHWPEYLMEAAGLGLFMISAALFGTLLRHPGSPIHQLVASDVMRRALMGAAMGLTVVGVIYSPWGQQSGAHLNPSLTLTFLRLGKIDPRDALLYVVAQFAGGAAGLGLISMLLQPAIAHSSVNYMATLPGSPGPGAAFLAEVAIAFVLMLVVLYAANHVRLERFTGLFAGALICTYFVVVAPVSGMSLNPARSLASALPPRLWQHLWIYFTAPPLGALLAAQLYLWRRGKLRVFCAKLHHRNERRCIFRCNYHELRRTEPAA